MISQHKYNPCLGMARVIAELKTHSSFSKYSTVVQTIMENENHKL